MYTYMCLLIYNSIYLYLYLYLFIYTYNTIARTLRLKSSVAVRLGIPDHKQLKTFPDPLETTRSLPYTLQRLFGDHHVPTEPVPKVMKQE